jgi:hypothetical protein
MFKNISKILNSYLVNFKNDFINSAKDKKKSGLSPLFFYQNLAMKCQATSPTTITGPKTAAAQRRKTDARAKRAAKARILVSFSSSGGDFSPPILMPKA